ncbi:class I SAM-dependent methyltransferase [Kitasatospora camelliae]|uniref:Class I SAM-dependent methyltransferase n=1 Tax=Kitasatospora camelliae TaxID=3156397 RepID=A0AAU8K2D3_9ACTN
MDSHAWDDRYRTADLVWGSGPNRWVAGECADLPPGRALDLAAGEGRNGIWLAERGWRVTAVDFSRVALDRGRTLAAALPAPVSDRLTWIEADLRTAVPAEEGAYDLVLVAYLHLPADQRRAVLTAAARALAPGGTLLVVGHDTTNLTEGTGGPQDPAVLFTPEDLLADLADHGLTTVAAERRHRTAGPSGDPDREAVDALVRLHRPE